jgi:hypothetical protein
MEAISSSDTSVSINETTWRYISQMIEILKPYDIYTK